MVVNYISDPAPAEDVAKAIGSEAAAIEADVSSEAAVQNLFARAAEALDGATIHPSAILRARDNEAR